MYREWKSGASFRKARPAWEFTTSWEDKAKSAHDVCLISIPNHSEEADANARGQRRGMPRLQP